MAAVWTSWPGRRKTNAMRRLCAALGVLAVATLAALPVAGAGQPPCGESKPPPFRHLDRDFPGVGPRFGFDEHFHFGDPFGRLPDGLALESRGECARP